MDFREHVVIVTGAGRGIGYGICAAFAEAGAYVALNDIDGGVANAAADRINSAVDREAVTAYPLDVADSDAVREMVQSVADQYGRLDVVVANAGLSHYGRFLDYEPVAFDRVMAVNLRGTYYTAQAAARAMIDQETPAGRILFMSSVTGQQAYPNLSAYGMTKAGISHLARVLAVELGAYRITVNAICPGATVTERTLADDPDYDMNWQAVTPNRHTAQVKDIVHTTTFLASVDARHITGQTIVVDGGWTLTSPVPDDTPDIPDESSQLR